MPGRDGTGPMPGRGFKTNAIEYRGCLGLGLGRGNGCRRSFRSNLSVPITQKEWLTREKVLLENRIEAIIKQLENC